MIKVTNLLRRLHSALMIGGLSAILTTAICTTTASAQSAERSCKEQFTLRSQNSTTASTITFVNTSGNYRAIDWIDTNGARKSFGGLNPGETKAFETFANHAWVISTGPGDCIQMFVATAQPQIVELPRAAVDGPRPIAAPKTSPRPTPRPVVCARHQTLIDGRCVTVQRCGPNSARTRDGDCACLKHFTRRNGRCVRTASTCKTSEVYSSSLAQCIPRDNTPKPCPKGQYRNQLGKCQPNQTGG